jgi:hypothetical protein
MGRLSEASSTLAVAPRTPFLLPEAPNDEMPETESCCTSKKKGSTPFRQEFSAMMPSFIAVSPYLIPLFGIAVAFVGYRKHDDARFAEALSAIAIAGCLVAALQHEMFNGYTMAFTAGLTGVTMFGYAWYSRHHTSC